MSDFFFPPLLLDKINQYKERERNETKVLEWKKFKVLFCGLDHGARIRGLILISVSYFK